MTIRLSTIVGRPIDHVFAHVSEPGPIAERTPEVVSWEWAGEPGIRTGSRFTFMKDDGVGRFEHTTDVLSCDPPTYFETRTHARRVEQHEQAGPKKLQPSRFTTHEVWRLSPAPGGTEVSVQFSVSFRGLWRLAGPFVQSGLKPALTTALDDLKRAAEADR